MHKAGQNGQSNTSHPDPVQEPPLGKALFRVMRAMIFDDKPVPELDALPMAQLRLLWTIQHGGEGTMKEFSERLRVSQSTVTQLAERLVKRGLIERGSDPADRRIVRLRLGEEGRRILEVADTRRREILFAVWDTLTQAQQEQIMDALELLGRHAEKVRYEMGRPLSPMPHLDSEEAELENGDTAQPVMDILSRRVRGSAS